MRLMIRCSSLHTADCLKSGCLPTDDRLTKSWRSSSPGRTTMEEKHIHQQIRQKWECEAATLGWGPRVVVPGIRSEHTFVLNCSQISESLWNSMLASSCNTGMFFNFSKCILKRESEDILQSTFTSGASSPNITQCWPSCSQPSNKQPGF